MMKFLWMVVRMDGNGRTHLVKEGLNVFGATKLIERLEAHDQKHGYLALSYKDEQDRQRLLDTHGIVAA